MQHLRIGHDAAKLPVTFREIRKQALDVRLGRKVALASAYNLLHRHGWRKLAPDKRHPKADVAAQEAWKKNSPTSSRKSPVNGKAKDPSG